MVIYHIIALCITFALVLYADEQAFQYMRGKIPTFNMRRVKFMHYVVACGLAAVMITGGLLYVRAPHHYLTDPTFIVKMTAVLALIINSAFIERFSARAVEAPFASHTSSQKRAFLISGTISAMGWGIALVCGLLL